MRKGRICVIMACLAVALAGCGKQHDHKGKKPLVEEEPVFDSNYDI